VVCCCCFSLFLALVVRKGIEGRRCIPARLEEFGEILTRLCSSKLEAALPQLYPAGMAAILKPPMRRPLSLLLRKLDGALPPSGLVPDGLTTAVGRRSTPEGSPQAACSCSSAATPGGRRCPVAETPSSLIALCKLDVGCSLKSASPFLQILGS
jgi:hypothetical protein